MVGGRGNSHSAKRSRQLQLLSDIPPYRPTDLPILDARLRGTRFVALTPRSVLNPPAQTGMDFWSLNPYVGCEFGCTYCYARYAHRYVVERAHDGGKLDDAEFADFRGPHGWEAFEKRIFVKEGIVAALDRDLKRFFRSDRPTVRQSDPIVIGTATDPYQPAERDYKLTRAVLERLAGYEGLSVGIITKSPLVARDADVLRRLAEHNDIEILISLITVDVEVIRAFEARSPMPAARLRAVSKLAAAGLNVGLIVAPVLPGVTDDRRHLEALFRAAREAGARSVYASPLRLYPAIRDRFLPVLEARSPTLAARYRAAYARQGAAPRAYARALTRRIQGLQRDFGFPVNRGMQDRYEKRLTPLQNDLFATRPAPP
ncbi:MAG: radical SAM protein [Gemmatimonadetes bacterium]|nr:MAG: radical SAM protein [Gemmatimonadota bacterium]PYP62929.1 MAG: radical SAM protein [Gemmatimonadota bacterium]